jgi:hypothetical protein
MQAQTRGEALEQQVFSIDQAIAKIKSKWVWWIVVSLFGP